MIGSNSRYEEGGIKESRRFARDKGASKVYTLCEITSRPPQKVLLTVSTNKAQLIDLICTDMITYKGEFGPLRLIVTGSDPVLTEIDGGHLIR